MFHGYGRYAGLDCYHAPHYFIRSLDTIIWTVTIHANCNDAVVRPILLGGAIKTGTEKIYKTIYPSQCIYA